VRGIEVDVLVGREVPAGHQLDAERLEQIPG